MDNSNTMEYSFLKYEISDKGVCVLKISAPKSLNALNTQVLTELNSFVSDLPSNVKAIVLTGDGDKSFVAGADISQMAGFNREEGYEFGKFGASVFRKIEELEVPVIAAVNGFALGGGCELAMACDIRIAAKNAKFGQPEVSLGIIPGFSGTYRLSKIVGQGMAKEMIYTGKAINADEALRIGLVNSVLEQEELLPYCIKMAEKILSNAPIAVRFAKRIINENYDMDETAALALENRYFGDCFASQDQKDGMQAFLSKQKPHFNDK